MNSAETREMDRSSAPRSGLENQNELQVALQFNAPKRFHENCDNQGATLLIVKTNNGCIFGGFNPVSWISDFSYSATD